MEIGTLSEGDFFEVGLENSLYKKIVNMNLKQKKKNDSVYNFSLLVPCPNIFLVVCIFILIFHGIYSPLPTNIFFVEGYFSVCVVARSWEDLKFLVDLLY